MIRLRGLHKVYPGAQEPVRALDGVDLDVEDGQFVAVMGPSGSGKSTLLNVLGILDAYDTGEYRLAGHLMRDLSEHQAAVHRNRLLGFVFQSFNLIPFKTALENVVLPLSYQGMSRRVRRKRAAHYIDRVGLGDRADHYPHELSGGQAQRVAIARALVTDPKVILADEPTGNLDSHTSRQIVDLLEQVHAEGRTIVMVTHDNHVAAAAQRIVRMADGRVAAD